MTAHSIKMIGFDDDDALDDILSGFRLFADYKSFLPTHLTDILRKQHPHVELRSLELLDTPRCDIGGMPSPENKDDVIVDTLKIPIELRIHLSTNGHDLHELDVTLVINAENVQNTPHITSDMLIQNLRALS